MTSSSIKRGAFDADLGPWRRLTAIVLALVAGPALLVTALAIPADAAADNDGGTEPSDEQCELVEDEPEEDPICEEEEDEGEDDWCPIIDFFCEEDGGGGGGGNDGDPPPPPPEDPEPWPPFDWPIWDPYPDPTWPEPQPPTPCNKLGCHDPGPSGPVFKYDWASPGN